MIRSVRTLRFSIRLIAVLLAAVLCAIGLLQADQWVLRWRAERLLRDVQDIELHKTPWAQAQVLMKRWGTWGHYDGTCTAEACKYAITIQDWYLSGHLTEGGWVQRVFLRMKRTFIGRRIGGHLVLFYAGFIVQDGIIRRTFLKYTIDVPPPFASKDDDHGYGLIAVAQSRSSLSRNSWTKNSHWILGGDEQLAEHPYYKAGRPGGCEICMAAEVTYSISTPQDEIRRLTSFDFSCVTRWSPCTRVEDLTPAAAPWHLYWLEGDPPLPDASKIPPKPCDIPIWALGRDAIVVLSAEVKSSKLEEGNPGRSPLEHVRVRLLETLKGSTPWPIGATLLVSPYSGDQINPPVDPGEHLIPGKHYLLLATYHLEEMDRNHPPVPPELINGLPGIRLDRCGVLDDTPQNHAELIRGFSQNDSLRVPEF